MKLTIDRRKCLKSGQCTYLHPDLFREGTDGYPAVPAGDLEGRLVSEAEDAAEICPGQAILLVAGLPEG